MSEAIKYLAKTCVNIIEAQGLSEAEELKVALSIIGTMIQKGEREPREGREPIKGIENIKRAEKQMEFDFEEGEKEEEVKKETVEEAKLVARAGKKCACATCGKVVYEQVGDVMSTMVGADFMEAYAPIGHEKRVTRFRNIDGSLLVDCPLCGAESSIALIGSIGDIQNPGVIV